MKIDYEIHEMRRDYYAIVRNQFVPTMSNPAKITVFNLELERKKKKSIK